LSKPLSKLAAAKKFTMQVLPFEEKGIYLYQSTFKRGEEK
jgi:hypothetical protein